MGLISATTEISSKEHNGGVIIRSILVLCTVVVGFICLFPATVVGIINREDRCKDTVSSNPSQSFPVFVILTLDLISVLLIGGLWRRPF